MEREHPPLTISNKTQDLLQRINYEEAIERRSSRQHFEQQLSNKECHKRELRERHQLQEISSFLKNSWSEIPDETSQSRIVKPRFLISNTQGKLASQESQQSQLKPPELHIETDGASTSYPPSLDNNTHPDQDRERLPCPPSHVVYVCAASPISALFLKL